MSIIADSSDPKYWELRAIEQIREIHNFQLVGDEAKERLRLVIKLMALSLVKRGQVEKA